MALILGIETSCDETSAAIVEDGHAVHSNVVASQIDIHRRYGGVFPEVASRQHILSITPVLDQALADANSEWGAIDAVAVTHGPGLAGSLLVGVNAAKGLAFGLGRPMVGVSHIEAHIYANWLAQEREPEFPLVSLVVSGGHSELILMEGHGLYRRLGGTLDDAAGEAFDKVGRLLGLPYPGGPAIQKAARTGSPTSFKLPRAWLAGSYDFSFSGVKTAVLHAVRKYQPNLERAPATSPHTPLVVRDLPVPNFAASFQAAVVEVLVDKTCRAAEQFGARTVLLAGGVAANESLRAEMQRQSPVSVRIPAHEYCTDNAAMVASAGFYRLNAGHRAGWDLDVLPSLSLTAARQIAPAG